MKELPIRIKTVLKVLSYLAKKVEPANKYEIREKGKAGTQPTVLKVVDELKSQGLLRAETTKRKARGGKPSEFYVLTQDAVMFLLNHEKEMKKHRLDIDLLAKKYEKLFPKIFGLWPLFGKENVIDYARESLRWIAGQGFDSTYASLEWDPSSIGFAGSQGATIESLFFSSIIHPDIYHAPELADATGDAGDPVDWEMVRWEKWLKAIKTNQELGQEVLSSIKTENSLIQKKIGEAQKLVQNNQVKANQIEELVITVQTGNLETGVGA